MDETVSVGEFKGQVAPATNYLLAVMNQVAALYTVSNTNWKMKIHNDQSDSDSQNNNNNNNNRLHIYQYNTWSFQIVVVVSEIKLEHQNTVNVSLYLQQLKEKGNISLSGNRHWA